MEKTVDFFFTLFSAPFFFSTLGIPSPRTKTPPPPPLQFCSHFFLSRRVREKQAKKSSSTRSGSKKKGRRVREEVRKKKKRERERERESEFFFFFFAAASHHLPPLFTCFSQLFSPKLFSKWPTRSSGPSWPRAPGRQTFSSRAPPAARTCPAGRPARGGTWSSTSSTLMAASHAVRCALPPGSA